MTRQMFFHPGQFHLEPADLLVEFGLEDLVAVVVAAAGVAKQGLGAVEELLLLLADLDGVDLIRLGEFGDDPGLPDDLQGNLRLERRRVSIANLTHGSTSIVIPQGSLTEWSQNRGPLHLQEDSAESDGLRRGSGSVRAVTDANPVEARRRRSVRRLAWRMIAAGSCRKLGLRYPYAFIRSTGLRPSRLRSGRGRFGGDRVLVLGERGRAGPLATEPAQSNAQGEDEQRRRNEQIAVCLRIKRSHRGRRR